MPGAINFNDADIKRAGATAGVRQRVGRGRGRPKAASVLSARWRLGAVTYSTFIDIRRLQRLRCTLLIIICFLSTLVSRPTARCRKSQFLIIRYWQSARADSRCCKILPIFDNRYEWSVCLAVCGLQQLWFLIRIDQSISLPDVRGN